MKRPPSFHFGKECRREEGFTLLELLIVIALIGILTTLYAPQLGTVRERAEKVVCMGHLRSLHVALGAYLSDNETWPQCPENLEGAAEEQFWFDALKEYGVTQKDWQCPTLSRQLGINSGADTSDAPKMHYMPANFDDNPMTPRRWPGMPWLVEIADIHHGGALMIRADGAVQTDLSILQAGGGQ